MPEMYTDRLSGLLLGTAVGDAMGLPAEGMRPETIKKLGWIGNWKHRFAFGKGMWSDDTEHTIMLAQSLLNSGDDVECFTRSFAWELRWWLIGMPAGVGLATARSLIKLWLGFRPSTSGVFSAGNGPCMRAAIVGALYPYNAELRHAFTIAHTRMTHTDPKAFTASLAVTELAALLSQTESPPNLTTTIDLLSLEGADKEWIDIIRKLEKSLANNAPINDFLKSIGGNPKRGISGYAYHTVAAVIFLGVKHSWNIKTTLPAILNAGGDSDSTGAIAGALCGAYGGLTKIPAEWINNISEWPTKPNDLIRLAEAFSLKSQLRIRPYWAPALIIRNLYFLSLVLIHGIARLLPISWRSNLQPQSFI